jgi:hypothetical protein
MQFEKGRPKTGGRAKGARNRIAYKLIEALERDFQEHGEEAVRITRIERPYDYLKIIASVIPRELEIVTENRVMELTDDELNDLIEARLAELAERRRAALAPASGEEPTTH